MSVNTDKITRAKLHKDIDDIQLGIQEVHSALAETYFK